MRYFVTMIISLFLLNCSSDIKSGIMVAVKGVDGKPLNNVTIKYECNVGSFYGDYSDGIVYTNHLGIATITYVHGAYNSCIYGIFKEGYYPCKKYIKGIQKKKDTITLNTFDRKICYEKVYIGNPYFDDSPAEIFINQYLDVNKEDSIFISDNLKNHIDFIYKKNDTLYFEGEDVEFIRLSDDEYLNLLQGKISTLINKKGKSIEMLGFFNDNFLIKNGNVA